MAFEDVYPVRWTGRQALVALPEHIDASNAGQIREELLSVINQGAEPLIVDMTATISCDRAGADAVARATSAPSPTAPSSGWSSPAESCCRCWA